ncbi:MAG: ABC transporter ATP-binding protein [Deltaproteobacteria bacterium]|nr:ABC transporter ATP-binding protein [Deltaproteobacteria bacterium]
MADGTVRAAKAVMHNKHVVNMEAITKTFGIVRALDKVTFTLDAGEIRGLVGENGAGKTTLMNILYGMYQPDGGNIRVWNEDVSRNWSPRLAISKGIGMIHQHFSLIPNHTVLENIVMPTLKWGDIVPQWKRFESQVETLCGEYGFKVKLNERAEVLSVGERQQVEILKALYQGARVLIMDEPTGVLTPQQAESLLELLLQARERGHSVVLVTHKLNEAMAISDRITVLRGGKHVATVEKKSTTPQEIAKMMVDREWISPVMRNQPPAQPQFVLEVDGVTIEEEHREPVVENISLSIGAGEILGVAGVAGNGQMELAEVILGIKKPKSGRIFIGGKNVTRWSIRNRRRAGLGYIPEDRHTHGVITEMTVGENLVLDCVEYPPYSQWGITRSWAIDKWAKEAVQSYGIKTPGINVPVANLSGGNQQKVVLAKALSMNPKILVACQPTRGLDFSATEYVRKKIVECAESGVAICLISSDLDELLELSHRIAVMFQGKIVGEFSREGLNLDQLGLLMAGHRSV